LHLTGFQFQRLGQQRNCGVVVKSRHSLSPGVHNMMGFGMV